MIQDRDIDAVIISTLDHWHAQPAVEAALAGKDIYLQKPTSLTVKEGRIVSDIVRRNGIILQMGTQQRSSPQFRIAAELVRNGRIGKLRYDPVKERFTNSEEANAMLSRPERAPYGLGNLNLEV